MERTVPDRQYLRYASLQLVRRRSIQVLQCGYFHCDGIFRSIDGRFYFQMG